jgi:hypothetical protein
MRDRDNDRNCKSTLANYRGLHLNRIGSDYNLGKRATLLIRCAQVLVSIVSLKCPKLLLWIWALPLRDLLSFLVWATGAFRQGVYWRGRRLRVEADGLITEWS